MTQPLRTLATLALLIAVALPSFAETAEEQLAWGERLYRTHCLNCHGEHAKGDGPMAPLLKTPVADLTRLAADHGGEFPAEAVHQAIDGRLRVSGHGLREMPVWGLSFQDRGRGDDQEPEVQARLRALVAYLASIQPEEPESEPKE